MAATVETLEKDIPGIESVEKGSEKWVDMMNDAIWNAGINTITDISICEHMLVVAHDSGYSSGIAHAIRNLAYFHLWIGEGPKIAVSLAQDAIKRFRKLSNRFSEATAWDIMALSYSKLGSLNKALEHTVTSMNIFESVGYEIGIAWGYHNIGMIYHQAGDLNQAGENLRRSLAMFKDLDYRDGQDVALLQLTEVCKSFGKYPEAIEMLEAGLRHQDGSRKATTLLNLQLLYGLTEFYILSNNQPLAGECFAQLELGFKDFWEGGSIQKTEFQTQIAILKARIEKNKGNHVLAIKLFEKVLKHSEEHEFKDLQTICHKQLAESYEEIKDYEEALNHQKTYSEISEEMQSTANQVKVDNLRLSLDIQKVEESNQKIIGSIEYAKLIQNSLLPSNDQLEVLLPNRFVIWKPRDIVGGDIYCVESHAEGTIIAMIDCTGHGVPGAFMTMLAASALKGIINEWSDYCPAEILKRLNKTVKTTLRQDTDFALSDDGLDASVCFISHEHQKLIYAGARLPLVYLKNGELFHIKGDRQSIGYKRSKLDFAFRPHEVDVEEGMRFFLFTDGLVDQLGGERRFSYSTRRLKDLLLSSGKLSLEQQEETIWKDFEQYRNANEIQDDITFLGFEL